MAQEPGPPIEQLIARWVGGDAAAGEEIYRRYHTRAWRFAISLGSREADADDISQQALAAGLEGIKGGARPDHFTGWILGIVRHMANREWEKDERRQEAAIHVAAPAPGPGPRTQIIQQEMGGLLKRVLDGLDVRDREALWLRVGQKLRREEAAARLGVSASTIDKRVDRALSRLREALSRHLTTQVLPGVLKAGPEQVTLAAVARLRPAFRETFELRHLQGMSLEEVGTRLGVPARTVAARLRHAYEELRCGPDDDFAAVRGEYRASRG